MGIETWRKRFQHRRKTYVAVFLKRPFREGLEVRVETEAGQLRIAELGLGEKALINRLKAEIDKILPKFLRS